MLINKNYVHTNNKLITKTEVFEFIANKVQKENSKINIKELATNFANREKESSTGFEQGIAIPHAKIKNITEPIVFVLKSNGIEWDSLDKKPATCIIAIIVPENGGSEHLKILGNLSKNLIDDKFRTSLQNGTKDKVVELINGISESTTKQSTKSTNGKRYVAVTKCPVGIAHTYMAAENLEKAAKEMGVDIQVETQGSTGVENEISSDDLIDIEGVIISADVEIDKKDRFNGLKVIEVPIKDALKDPKALINKVSGAKILNVTTSDKSDDKDGDTSVIKYVLNGVSHMIPFVVVGGLMIALSLSLGGVATATGVSIPEDSFWNTINQIGALGFYLMIPILAGYTAYAIAGRAALAPAMIGALVANSPEILKTEAGTGFIGAIIVGLMAGYIVKYINKFNVRKELRAIMPIFVIPIITTLIISFIFVFLLGTPISFLMEQLNNLLEFLSSNAYTGILLGIVLGAMVAVDMGGPINKVAFLFGVAAIPTNPVIMGGVAAAIAVPPLSAGIATLIAPNKFNEEEKSTGIAAILMGLIGITEGAIPFAASQPKAIIPIFMIGSAISSTIAVLFNIGNTVPHGGPIVGILGATTNVWLYFMAIAAGTVVSALLMARFKKIIK